MFIVLATSKISQRVCPLQHFSDYSCQSIRAKHLKLTLLSALVKNIGLGGKYPLVANTLAYLSSFPHFLSLSVSGGCWTQTLDLGIMRHVFYHCATTPGGVTEALFVTWSTYQTRFFWNKRPSLFTSLFNSEPTQVKHLSSAPLKGRPLSLPANIRLDWKGLPGTNTLA